MRWVAALLVLGAAVRIWIALDAAELGRDARYRYVGIAENVAEGRGYRIGDRPTAQAMPLWPLALAAWPFAPRSLSVLLSVAALPLAWRLARRLGGARAALLVLGLLAVDLDSAVLAGSAQTEPLFALLLLAFGLSWARGRPVAAAAFLGLAALTRPEACLVPLFLAPFGWRRAALLLAGVAVALAPWVVRNAVALDAFVPFTTTGGITLHAGMNAAEDDLPFRKKGQGRGATYVHVLEIDDEVAYDRALRREALAYARAHPGRALELLAAKAMLLWTPVQRKGTSAVYALATLLVWWALWRRVRFDVPLVGPFLLLMTCVGLCFLALPRYRVPYHPLVFLLAARGIWPGGRDPENGA